ncbi:ribonuclease [Corynebacterium sp. CCM 9185]|uniref:Ribonuclease n=1 Tax=Corynebacterium marambiense TaxID=2765364 RepID=A0ABS0VX68_9CORY|nr:ribonuclease domain-containing protein [Corynebacterium marambiense]MBI9000966.1 ribonuclease [Corynebacterium marambiense]MCK7662763.1 ribonuclease [Corynebacterium marambiense]MCX7542372.1 ribonuclease [Corynebacterium marambiense]
MDNRRLLGAVAGAVLVLGAAWFGIDLSGDPAPPSAPTRESARPSTTQAPPSRSATRTPSAEAERTCPLDTLPEQAELVVEDILAGGPFDHPAHDGKHFGNYERRLPRENNSYYREYTVETPGLRHRGERRIITGGGSDRDPDVWYYTDDHYDSFCLIPDAEENR